MLRTIKGHHIAMASACGRFVKASYFSRRRTSTNVNHNGWSSSWIARWVASRAGQLRPGYLVASREAILLAWAAFIT